MKNMFPLQIFVFNLVTLVHNLHFKVTYNNPFLRMHPAAFEVMETIHKVEQCSSVTVIL
jgi:hypothetical protein